MMMPLKYLATSFVIGLFAFSPTNAADIRDRTIKVGIGLSADHPQGQAVTRFADIVGQKSGGKIKVRLFAGGALGNDVTMISALQGGTQEMTIPDTSTLVGISGLKDFGLINLPEKGLIGFGFWENGFRQVTNSRRPITKAEDFAGLKLRVIQNPLFIDTFRELGANAVPMPFTEVYTALETKTIDGQENPLATILASKFHEVQKYTVQSNHIYSVWAFLMSKRFWDRLTPDEQALITEAADEAKEFERKTIRAFEVTASDELKSKGMEVSSLTEPELAKLREKTKPVRDKFTNEFGQSSAAEMLAELERIRSTKR